MSWKRWSVYTLVCSAVCVAVYFLRKGAVVPLFALADGLSVSGFFVLLISLLPKLLSLACFDGFCYAAQLSVAGFFPKNWQTYRDYKADRGFKRKNSGVLREGVLVGMAFLSLGLLLSVLFS